MWFGLIGLFIKIHNGWGKKMIGDYGLKSGEVGGEVGRVVIE